MRKQPSKTRRVILFGGTFDDRGGEPSAIIAQMHAAMPDGTVLFNGGYFNEIPQLIKEIAFFDVILWFPNVPNEKEKIRDIKKRYPDKFVVTSKRNGANRYTTEEIIGHAQKLDSDLVVEFSDTVPFKMRLLDRQGNVFEDTKAPETLARTLLRQIDDLARGSRPSSCLPINERTLINGILIGGEFDEHGGGPSQLINKLHTAFPEEVDLRNGGSLGDLRRIMDDLARYEVVMWFPHVIGRNDPWLPTIKDRYPFKTLIAPMFNPDGTLSFQQMVNLALGLRSNLFVEFEGPPFQKMRLYDPLSNQFAETTDPQELGRAIMTRLEALRKFTRQGTMSVGKALLMPDCDELSLYLSIIRDYGERIHGLIQPTEGVERFLGNAAFRASHMFPGHPEYRDIMFISRRNVDKAGLGKEGFVPVQISSYVNPRIAYYGGNKPSVDTTTQTRFFDRLPNVNFIWHAHVYIDAAPFIQELIPCGSVDEVEEVFADIGHDYSRTNFAVNLLGHGSILFAHNLEYLTKHISYKARPAPELLSIEGSRQPHGYLCENTWLAAGVTFRQLTETR